MMSEDILSGKLKSGDVARVGVEDGEFILLTTVEITV
jgi:hypothetical protein